MKKYLQSLSRRYLLIFAFLVLILAVVNNLRSPASRSVSWIGSQEILEKPEGF